MSDTDFCIQVTIPPAGQEEALFALLAARFAALQPEHLAPCFETGEPFCLTVADRPGGLELLRALQQAGFVAETLPAPRYLQRERSLVGSHPAAPGERLVVHLGRVVPPARATALPVSLPPMVDLPAPLTATGTCKRCAASLLAEVTFCPACGYQEQATAIVTRWLSIRLPEGPERTRALGWLAKATELPLTSLPRRGGERVRLRLSAPERVHVALNNQFQAWDCMVAAEPPPPELAESLRGKGLVSLGAVGLANLVGLSGYVGGVLWPWLSASAVIYFWPELTRWWQGEPPLVALAAAQDLASPIPLALAQELQGALEATTSPSLRAVVARAVQETAGIFAAIATPDAISNALLREVSPSVAPVVDGLLSLVARGRQIELYLQSHPIERLEQERHRLERLRDKTADAGARRNYELALGSNEKAVQTHQELCLAGERLASQLLVVLTGLGEVRSRLTLAGVRESNAGAGSSLVRQLRDLQREANACDAGLAGLFQE